VERLPYLGSGKLDLRQAREMAAGFRQTRQATEA
jgi:hypothetical protein